MTHIEVIFLMRGIDCAHFLSMKNYLDPDSGNGVGVWAKKENFRFNTPTVFPESGSR